MIRRFALVSGLILTGAVAFSPKAFAQSVDVNFEGNIGPQCSFAAPTPGRLVYATQEQFAGSGTISSDAPGGVSGEVEVLCNTNADIEISDARFVSFTPTNPEFNNPAFPPDGGDLEVIARVPGAETSYFGPAEGGGSSNGSIPLFTPLSPEGYRQIVEVDLMAFGTNFEAGIYEYAVTLTVVP